MSSAQDMFNSIPPLTRTWLGLCLLTTGCVRFSLVNPYNLLLYFPNIIEKFEIWRLATSFLFFGPFSFNYFIEMYLLVSYSARLEVDPFPTTRGVSFGSTPDYAFCMLFCALLLVCMGWVFEMVILGPALSFAMLYVWSKRSPDAPVKIWMFSCTGAQLPFVLMGFNFLVGNSLVMSICGAVAGHVFYFLVEVLPLQRGGQDIINTPEWLVHLCNRAQGVVYQPPVGAAAGNAPRAAPARHNWGAGGNRLGGE